ncbi:hypothetical protein SESBI_08849 [Sesbania bispinosa]|nr:hypothetical protein SESBI_08849 [Sesbania bispinosa]
MGNCCKTAPSSMEYWAGDEWGSLTSKHKKKSSSKVFDEEVDDLGLGNYIEKERLLGVLRASSDANGKVKIKISKKELVELLGTTDHKMILMNKQQQAHHASPEQVLARLINARDHVHHTPWKPVLQSIPEVN